MQVTMVMMLALTGLGCQNKTDAVAVAGFQVDSPPLASFQEGGYSAGNDFKSFAPTPYPEIPSRLYSSDSPPHSVDWHAELRSTLYSFVFGHDPDVSTVREIEASVYGTNSGLSH